MCFSGAGDAWTHTQHCSELIPSPLRHESDALTTYTIELQSASPWLGFSQLDLGSFGVVLVSGYFLAKSAIGTNCISIHLWKLSGLFWVFSFGNVGFSPKVPLVALAVIKQIHCRVINYWLVDSDSLLPPVCSSHLCRAAQQSGRFQPSPQVYDEWRWWWRGDQQNQVVTLGVTQQLPSDPVVTTTCKQHITYGGHNKTQYRFIQLRQCRYENPK